MMNTNGSINFSKIGKQFLANFTIIIMTSNIGSEQILEARALTDQLKRSIEDKLYKTFRPEFLNRIDAIVFFKLLSQDDVKKIARIQLDELKKRLEKQNITLKYDDSVITEIAHRGYVPELGARPLKRAIQQYITVPISHFLLKNPEARKIAITCKKDEGIIINSN